MRIDEIVSISDETLGGTPVFKGTRVPIESLFQHIESGITLNDFLDDFPSVTKENAIAMMQFSNNLLLSVLPTLLDDKTLTRRKSA